MMAEHTGENLARVMAAHGLSAHDVAARSGLDQRTIRGILGGTKRPHARTLHRLAAALEVSVGEFFLDPAQLLYRRFDRHSNPVVEEVLESHRNLCAGWTEADFDELHSRVGAGGALTFAGALQAIRAMNRKHDLHAKFDLLLESTQAELLCGIVEVLYQQVVFTERGPKGSRPTH